MSEELDKLKQENEELKKKVESYVCSTNCYKYQEAVKYKQTLKEIKEIASLCSYATPPDFYETRMKQILEKCEVIDD